MTVKELIEELQVLPQNYIVKLRIRGEYVGHDDYSIGNILIDEDDGEDIVCICEI